MMYPLIDALEWLRSMYYYTNNTRKDMNVFDQPHMKPIVPVPGDVAPFPNGYVSYSPVNPINNLYNNLPTKYAKNIALDPEVKNAREKFSKCNHINIYGADGVEYNKTENTMHCPICGATWPIKLIEAEEFENAMDVVMTVIQNIKWFNNNNEDFNNIMNNNYGYKNNNLVTQQFPHIRAIFPKEEETDTE